VHTREESRSRVRRSSILLALLVLFAAALAAAPALAGSGGKLRIETAWYDGHEISFLQPSLFSAKPNGGIFACFGLGPDFTGIDRPAQPIYVIVDDTATQDHCDGDPTALRHEHVLPVAPGDPGYTGAWRIVLLVEAQPGSIDLGANPFTSAAEVENALEAGLLVEVPTGGVTFLGPVIGGDKP